MIRDVVGQLDTLLNDASVGVNAQINADNAQTGDTVPTVATIQTWGPTDGSLARLPVEMDLPALVLAWVDSGDLTLVSQGKRRARHRLRLFYFDDEPDQYRARRYMGAMETVLLRVLDKAPGRGTIVEVRVGGVQPRQWLTAGRGDDVARLEVEFEVIEIDETP